MQAVSAISRRGSSAAGGEASTSSSDTRGEVRGLALDLAADDDPLQPGQLEADQAGDELGVAEEDPGVGLGEDVFEQRAAVGGVDRDLDRAGAEDPEPARDELRDVAHHHRAAVAGLDPPGAQGAGDAAAAGVDLTDRGVAGAGAQQRVVGVAGDRGVERLGHRRRRGESVRHRCLRRRMKAGSTVREEKRQPASVRRKVSRTSPSHFGSSMTTGSDSSPSSRSWRKLIM